MATPPTRVSYNTPTAGYGSTTATKTSPGFDVQAGDLITFVASGENETATIGTPSATGGSITWTSRQSIVVSLYCTMYVWTGAVGATATGITVSATAAGGKSWSFGATVWRNHGGVGVSGKTNVSSGAPSLTLTGVSANSAIVCGSDDWNAADGTTRTWRTVNGAAMTESLYFRNSATYTVYSGYAPNAGTGGSVTVGLSAPGAQKYSIAAVEVLGTTGGGTTYTVSGTASATSGAAGAVAAAMLVAGTASGVSGSSGDVTVAPRTYSVSGTAAAISGSSGDVTRPTVTVSVSGTAAAVSSSSGDVTRAGAAQTVSGTAAVVSGSSGAASSLLGVSGTVAAVSGSSGDVTRVPRTLAVSGTAAAVSGSSGSVSVVGGPQTYPVSGVAAVVSGSSGSVRLLASTSGAAAVTSGASGVVVTIATVTGTAFATSTSAGSVTALAQVAGTVSAVSGSSGDVTRYDPSGFVDVRVLAVVDRSRVVTITDRSRTVTITEHPRTVTITDRS